MYIKNFMKGQKGIPGIADHNRKLNEILFSVYSYKLPYNNRKIIFL